METTERYGGPAPSDCLLKHDNPRVITRRFSTPHPIKRGARKNDAGNVVESADLDIILPILPKPEKREERNPNILDINSPEDILDFILPPRLWVDNGQQFTQRVSRIPATRMDVLNLQERLDNRHQQLQARETGICPIRRELYSQAFDELIRQATLECAERGLMLLRVRDEIRMTIQAYQALFESSMAYGMRKVLLSEQGKSECSSKIVEFGKKNVELQHQVDEWKLKYNMLEKKNEELRQQDSQRKEDELAAVKRTNNQLATVLDNIIVQRTLVFNTGSLTAETAANEGATGEKSTTEATVGAAGNASNTEATSTETKKT